MNLLKVMLPVSISALLLFLSTNIVSAHGVSRNSEQRVQASVKLQDYKRGMTLFNQMGLDISGVDRKNSIVDLVLNSTQYNELSKRGVKFFQINNESKSANPLGLDPEYKNPKEIEQILRAVAAKYPKITRLFVIGKSNQGRNIYALKISDNVSRDEVSEPAILFNSMHHAREVMTPEASLDIIEQLVTLYGKDSNITKWVNNNQIYVVPMLNVDGNNKVWNGRRMWRKNVTSYGGVDLNRNYPYKWGACKGSSGNANSDTFRGPSAASEPETRALMRLVDKIRPVFNISYHAYSELVIYPMGCDGQRAINYKVVEAIGKKIGKMLRYTPGTAWETLYSVDGGDIDWMNGMYQVIPYVLELNSRSEGFQPNYKKWRDVTVKKVRPAWKFLFEQLEGPSIRGYVRTSRRKDTSLLKARLYKVMAGKLIPYLDYKVNPNGSFHMVVPPGRYILKVESKSRTLKERRIVVPNNRRVNLLLEVE